MTHAADLDKVRGAGNKRAFPTSPEFGQGTRRTQGEVLCGGMKGLGVAQETYSLAVLLQVTTAKALLEAVARSGPEDRRKLVAEVGVCWLGG